MLLTTINDTHFGIKSDAPYMLDNQEHFYKHVFFPTLLKKGIKNILHGGDLVDRRRYINFTSLNRMKNMFFEPAKEYGMTIDIIPGNHDVALKNTNEINSLCLLLKEYTNVNIIEQPIVKEFGSKNIMLLPWMNTENFKDSMDFVNANDADILYGHLELAGFEMYDGVPNNHGLDAELFSKFGKVWTGHFHKQSKVGNIHYLGAPMEFTWSDAGSQRGFHIYDTETDTLTFKQNPDTLHEKVYYNDDGPNTTDWDTENLDHLSNKIVKVFVTAKKSPASFERFVERLYNIDTIDLTINENYSEFNESLVDVDTKDCSTAELMSKYIDNAETSMDKPRLKNILSELYVEALHAEGK